MAWLWRGAGTTFTFKLSLPLLEAVGLQGPQHSQRGPRTLLCPERWVLPQPKHPHTRNPLPSGCLTSENVQELVVSVAKLTSAGTELATSTLSQVLCPWGGPALTACSPQPQRGQCRAGLEFGTAGGSWWETPMAPLRNPQPAPETSSRSQREPADLAAASEGGGMKGGREGSSPRSK